MAEAPSQREIDRQRAADSAARADKVWQAIGALLKKLLPDLSFSSLTADPNTQEQLNRISVALEEQDEEQGLLSQIQADLEIEPAALLAEEPQVAGVFPSPTFLEPQVEPEPGRSFFSRVTGLREELDAFRPAMMTKGRGRWAQKLRDYFTEIGRQAGPEPVDFDEVGADVSNLIKNLGEWAGGLPFSEERGQLQQEKREEWEAESLRVQEQAAAVVSFFDDVFGDMAGVEESVMDFDQLAAESKQKRAELGQQVEIPPETGADGGKPPTQELRSREDAIQARIKRETGADVEETLVEMRTERIGAQPEAFLDVMAAEVAAPELGTFQLEGAQDSLDRAHEDLLGNNITMGSIKFFLRSRRDQLDKGQDLWLGTDDALTQLSKAMLADPRYQNGTISATDWLFEYHESGQLQTDFHSFVQTGGGKIGRDAVRATMLGTATQEQHALGNAIFENVYGGRLDEIIGQIENREIQIFAESGQGNAAALEFYYENLRAQADISQGILLDDDISLITSVQSLDEDDFTRFWTNRHPDRAMDVFVTQLLSGLPSDLVRTLEAKGLHIELKKIVVNEFNRQLTDADGADLSHFLEQAPLGPVGVRLVGKMESFINKQRIAIQSGAIISPQFFSDDMNIVDLFELATENLRSDLGGKEPTFAQVTAEVREIQNEQITEFLSAGMQPVESFLESAREQLLAEGEAGVELEENDIQARARQLQLASINTIPPIGGMGGSLALSESERAAWSATQAGQAGQFRTPRAPRGGGIRLVGPL